MATLKFFKIFITILCFFTIFYLFYLADKKEINEWKIKNKLSLNVKTDDLYLVNNNYSFSNICELNSDQEKSNFFKICKFIKKNENIIFKNDNETISSLILFFANKKMIESINNNERDKLLILINNISENNEYNKVYKSYFIYNLK